MDLGALINLVIQNGFLTVFACTVLYFMIKFSTVYLDKFTHRHNKQVLEDDLVLKLVRSEVWFASRGKVRHIESILIENDIYNRQEEVTRKVRNALEERTMVYIEYFNTLDTHIVRLGDYYLTVFDMEPFFQEVMDVVLKKYTDKDKALVIAMKIKDIYEVMYTYQMQANVSMEKELKRLAMINLQ